MLTESITPIRTSTLFLIFFKLGCISFGGPAAHLVLFHRTFVEQLKWLNANEYSQLVALAQILPGPTSSQVGLSIGYLANGYLGSFIAWLGFTLPAFIIMTSAAILGQTYLTDIPVNFFHTIHLIVLSVVIWAFWQMMRSYCKSFWQYILMFSAALFIYFASFDYNQILLILVAGCIGLFCALLNKSKENRSEYSNKIHAINPNPPVQQRSKHYVWLFIFVGLFFVFPLLKLISNLPTFSSLESLYQTASMVFGGGHVILPLMHQDFVITQKVSAEQFDLGYAIVQLIPGPLFSFAAYIGTYLGFSPSLIVNAAIATIMIFLPSFLLIFGTLPYWSNWVKNQKISLAVSAINVAVIGLLLSLIVQMSEKHLISWVDLVFVIALIALFKLNIPVWLSILLGFVAYQLGLTLF